LRFLWHGSFRGRGPLIQKQTVNTPVSTGAFAIVAGGVLLFVRTKK
jgi:hypothetical protein